jgi:hypothetical protein
LLAYESALKVSGYIRWPRLLLLILDKMHNVTAVPTEGGMVFYPMGNTPAVNFLSYHSPGPEDEAIEILSLACGDVRSILYTLWCEGRPG